MPGLKSKKATAERAMRRAREVARKATANPFTPKAMREPTKPKLAITVFATGAVFYVCGHNGDDAGNEYKSAFITAHDEATAIAAFKTLFPTHTNNVNTDDLRDNIGVVSVVAVAEEAE